VHPKIDSGELPAFDEHLAAWFEWEYGWSALFVDGGGEGWSRAAAVDELRRGLAIVRELQAPRLRWRDEAWLRARLEELAR
jgi:hypothetical protein